MKNPKKDTIRAARQEKRQAVRTARQEGRVINRGARLERSGKKMIAKASNRRAKGYSKGQLSGTRKSTNYKELDAKARIRSGREMQASPSSYTRVGGIKKTVAKRAYRNAPDINRPGTGATLNRRGTQSRKTVVKLNRPMRRR